MEFVFDTRSADSSLVEMVWHTHSERAGTFTSVAVSNWEMVITTFGGKTMITARGPETKASQADFPADAEFFGITFRLGTFMPHLPLKTLLDRQDATLPEASSSSFWLHGSAWELPTFENADVFVDRLVRQGLLARDSDSLASTRSQQRRTLRSTGLTRRTIDQIQRAQRAAELLQSGASPRDVAWRTGFADQAHLTRAVKRFVGMTPRQLSLSFKTNVGGQT